MTVRMILVALVLTSVVAGQEAPQEKRGAERLDGKKHDASLGYGRRHALVIGIDAYEDAAFPDLGYAVKDAKGVAKVLVERLSRKFSHGQSRK